MKPPRTAPGRARRAMALVALALAAAAEISSFEFHEFVPRLRALPAFAGISADAGRPHGSSAAFDRGYAAFLARLDREIPSNVRVALDVPSLPPYIFLGRYVLAPRRVMPVSRVGESEYVAAFPCVAAAGGFQMLGGGCFRRLR